MSAGEIGPWARLRAHTPARIGLARAGVSLATTPLLDFRAAHAAARDAVAVDLDAPALAAALASLGEAVVVESQAANLRDYLLRPDLGRALAPASLAALAARRGDYDLAIVIADGLSAAAAHRHAAPLLAALAPGHAPLVIARRARVALGDAAALALGARGVLTLIGERPGLSAPDSLGAYLTWRPRPDTTDAERNCVSNIRPEGLGYAEAARQITYLLAAARALNQTGVALKNRADEALPPAT